MKPGFALSLSFEGISLLQRVAGGWHLVGEVSLDVADMETALAELHEKALKIAPEGLACKLIIPNDQIRYLTIETGSFGGDARLEMARAALVGATPYAVEDLNFDVSFENQTTYIAAVARETLAEAEAFAVKYNFNPVSFVAVPDDTGFVGEPYFGETREAPFITNADEVERDDVPVHMIEPLAEVDSGTHEAEKIQPDEDVRQTEAIAETAGLSSGTAPAHPTPTPPEVRAAGFSSRRRKQPVASAVPPPTQAQQLAEENDTDLPGAEFQDLPPPAISVTSPTLEVPEPAQPEAETGAEAILDSTLAKMGEFLSRRRPKRAWNEDEPELAPVKRSTPAITIAPDPRETIVAADETARMTVFGARQPAQIGGKPRHLGLILTLALLVFLAAVATWASLFLENGVAGLFDRSQDETQLASDVELKAPEISTNIPETLPAPEPELSASAVEPAQNLLPQPTAPEALTIPDEPDPAALPSADKPEPNSIDIAVMDALRNQPPEELPSSESPGADYSAPGIWQTPPIAPETPALIGLDDLYVASIDRTDLSQDAVALPPAPGFETDLPLTSITTPSQPGTFFALDERGLVKPTKNGTINPDGVLVYLGRPSVVPPPTPTRFETNPEIDILRDRLAKLRPRLRPGDLVESNERAQLGGLTRAELSGVRPKSRPRTIKQEAEKDETPTAQAVVVSRRPNTRPRGFEATVKQARKAKSGPSELVAAATVAPKTVTPKIPSSASVARQATLDNAINLRRVNLIGVYGTPSNRRALVRLPSGRYKKVKVGDSVDGGRVLAIGDSELRYKKSGQSVTLKIPKG